MKLVSVASSKLLVHVSWPDSVTSHESRGAPEALTPLCVKTLVQAA